MLKENHCYVERAMCLEYDSSGKAGEYDKNAACINCETNYGVSDGSCKACSFTADGGAPTNY